MKRIRFFISGIALFFLFFFVALQIKAEIMNDKPNIIILITVDALRQDHLTLYGYFRNTSPELEKFSANAYVFDDAISQVPFTMTAAFSLMTGLYPPEMENIEEIYSNVDTLPYQLRSLDYYNMAVRGTEIIGSTTVFKKGFDEFYDVKTLPTYSDVATLNASVIVEKAKELVDNTKEKRIFLWLHFKDPHIRYLPSEEFKNTYRTEAKTFINVNSFWADGFKGIPRFNYLENHTDVEYYIDRYDEEILTLDKAFGEFIDYLENRSLLDSSMLLFCGLHGENLGENDYFFIHSSNIDEANIKVPIIVKYPNQDKSKRIKSMFSISGINKIIRDYSTDNETKPKIETKNALLLENLPLRENDNSYFETSYPKKYGMRTPNLKLTYVNSTGKFEAYDLINDSEEKHNLFDKKGIILKTRLIFHSIYFRFLRGKKEYEKKQQFKNINYENEQTIGINNDFINKFSFKKEKNGENMQTLTGKNGNLTMKIRIYSKLDKNTADIEKDTQIQIIMSLYDERQSPYPGVISNKIACLDEFKPKKVVSKNIFYELYSTNSFNYGGCSWDLIKKKAILGFKFCNETNSLYRIELFFPLEKEYSYYINQLQDISCE